jgi:hypothetical protein
MFASSAWAQTAGKEELPVPPGYGILRPKPTIQTPPAIHPPQRCPSGYLELNQSMALSNYIVCTVNIKEHPLCTAQAGHFACGRGGSECCTAGQENPCFAGAFACSPGAQSGDAARTACCISH